MRVLLQNESPVVVLKHMPVGTTKTVVRTFFKGFNIAENGIWYVYLANGEPASWGYVVFIDQSEARAAVEVRRLPAVSERCLKARFFSRLDFCKTSPHKPSLSCCYNLQVVDSLPQSLTTCSQR